MSDKKVNHGFLFQLRGKANDNDRERRNAQRIVRF